MNADQKKPPEKAKSSEVKDLAESEAASNGEPNNGEAGEFSMDQLHEWLENRMDVPDSINEEYYQVSPEILDCFPKYRFPLDLYRYKDDIATLIPYYKAQERVDNSLRPKIYQFCREGLLFVSREQQDIYTNFISRQIDMVLLDKNLKKNEISQIFSTAFKDRLDAFYARPLPEELDKIRYNVDVFIEYMVQEASRADDLICQVHRKNDLELKQVNVAFLSTALYIRYYRKSLSVAVLKKVVMGFLLHDVGMSKIPKFVTDNDRGLKMNERKRVQEHPIDGMQMLNNLGLGEDEFLLPATQHHERMDGSGYPMRLKGNDISMLGRIAAVADSYCAMTTQRPFTPEKKPIQAAVELLKDQQGYDPRLTTLLVKALQEISC